MKRNVRGAAVAGVLICAASAHADSGVTTAGRRNQYETVVRADSEHDDALTTTLKAEQARALPGAFGDALRAVEAAPGVARTALGSGQLIVWGAAPQETKVLLDGMELPALYHFGGQRALLPTAFVDKLTLNPGAYGAEYGRALGGLVLIGARPIESGYHGEVAVDLLDASALLSASIGSRLRVQAAGRYSYLDRALTALSGTELGDFFPLPRYYDFQAQATLALREREELTATVIGAGDELRRARALADAQRAQAETWQRTFYRASLRYQRHVAGGMHVSVQPWLGFDQNRYEASFGETPARLASRDLRYGARANVETPAGARLSVRAGVDVLGTFTQLEREGTLTRPPREGDRAVFGQSPGNEVNADAWSTHIADLATFLMLALRLGALRVEPELRAGGMLLDGSRLLPRIGAAPPIGTRRIDFYLEPRLRLRYRPTRRLEIVAATGLYHQPPEPADLSAVFGNPTLGPTRAVHASVGASVVITPELRVELAGFFRALDQLVARSPLVSPPLARALTQDGTGRSYGAQVQLQLTPWRNLSGFITYSISRSTRRDAPMKTERLSDFDQTHVLQVAARYVLFGFGIGLRLRYTSGLPRTEVLSAYYDARGDEYQPVFGTTNGIRLPDFVQLDARLDRTFALPRKLALTIQLEVQNVTNQKNAEEAVYRFDFSRRDYITGLPMLAVLGARLTF